MQELAANILMTISIVKSVYECTCILPMTGKPALGYVGNVAAFFKNFSDGPEGYHILEYEQPHSFARFETERHLESTKLSYSS